MQHGAFPDAVVRGRDGAAIVVAHRGAWDPAPQNSLRSFEQAVSDGADAIELDVRRTADRRLVVIHDARVGGRIVGRLDRDELRARLKPGQAPELHDVLELAAGRIAVDVELKEDGYVDQAMAVVTAHLAPDQFVVTSFVDSILPAVRRAVPEARTGLLLTPGRQVRELGRRVAETGVQFIAPHAGLARAGLLLWAARRGLPAWVWTVNDQRSLTTMLGDPRVEAVITDRAQRAVAIAGRAAAPPLAA